MIRAVGLPTILLAGGGTGGHLFPGLAVAEAVRAQAAGARLLLAATERDTDALHGRRLPIETVQVASPRRPAGLRDAPVFGARLVAAVARSLRVLRRERIDAVVGLGGYGSVAPVLAARLARLPVLLLEQNAVPGRATRTLARFADVVAESFVDSLPAPDGVRVVTTGNPLRRQVLATRPAHGELGLDPGVPVIGVLGGSLGARRVNLHFAKAVPALMTALGGPRGRAFQVVHATGSVEAAMALAELYALHGVRAAVRPFFDDMGAVYGTADMLLTRAGGTSVAEIAAIGLPAVFIPYPHHVDDHQWQNAAPLVAAGAASIVRESELTAERLADLFAPLVLDRRERVAQGVRARALGRPDAAARVARLLLECVRDRGATTTHRTERDRVSPPEATLSRSSTEVSAR